MANGVEEALNVRIEYPPHRFSCQPYPKCIQRIMLATPRTETIRKPQEVYLVDRLQYGHHCPLDKLVLQGSNA